VDMSTDSRTEFNKGPVFALCVEMGEPAVIADLERASLVFQTPGQKALAWTWVYSKRTERENARRIRERRLLWIALCTSISTAAVGIGGLLVGIHFGNRQIENARQQTENARQQTENAKRLLSVQMAREFRDGFDSKEMQRRRVATAAALLRGANPPTDAVLDFFESIGYYARQGLLDRETVWNDFSYTIMHYWPAVKAHARTGRDGDREHWVNFEWLNGELLQDAARRRHATVTQMTPSTEDVKEFLRDEANLLKPPKPPKPPPPKPRLTHG
jgi:hypothetical protein